MQDDASGKSPAPGAASATGPTADTPESDFLRRQADEARRAIADTLVRMQQSLKDSADLKEWTREYPWPTLGVAAVFGFLTAAALVPTARRGRKRQMSALVDDLLGDEEPEETAVKSAKRRRRSAVRRLVSPLLKMFAGALQSSIVAAFAARSQQPQPHEASTNGQQPAHSET